MKFLTQKPDYLMMFLGFFHKHDLGIFDTGVHCVAKVYAVWPVSTLKCLCSGGRD